MSTGVAKFIEASISWLRPIVHESATVTPRFAKILRFVINIASEQLSYKDIDDGEEYRIAVIVEYFHS